MSLSAQQISLTAGDTLCLDQVSCDIQPGKLTILIGPNGAGKTSLIRCLAGDISPNSGQVTLNQQALAKYSSNQLARYRAVLSQQNSLNFPLKVWEVVMLGRSPFKRHPQRDDEIVRAALEAFDALAFEQRWYPSLSGGEKQRVQLARVWAQISDSPNTEHQQKYLLLDEPSSALDLKHQQQLMERLVERVGCSELGVVVALHNLNTAARYADQLVLLKDGRCLAVGAAKDVLSEENIEHAYGIEVDIVTYPLNGKQTIVLPQD